MDLQVEYDFEDDQLQDDHGGICTDLGQHLEENIFGTPAACATDFC